MSTRLKLNVKNITLGCQSFSDVLGGNDPRIYNGFSRLVVPRSIPLRRPDCKYYKQDYVRRSTLNFAKLVLPKTPEKTYLKRTSSEIPLTGKWLDTVHPGAISAPGYGFPWVSTYSFYYDKQNPQCPPPNPKAGSDSDSCKKPTTQCGDKVPLPPKGDTSCNKKTEPKTDPCARKMCTFTVPLKNFRFYSSNACPPKGGGGGGEKPCKPKPCQVKKSKSKSKSSACPTQKKVKDCPPKGKKRTGSICPPKKKTASCAPKGRKRKASVCGPMKKKPKCPPKGKTSKGRPICGPKGKTSKGRSVCGPKGKTSKGRSVCGPKGKQRQSKGGRCAPKSKSSTTGTSSSSKCRPVLQKPRSCSPKSSKPKSESACGPQSQPKKPKC